MPDRRMRALCREGVEAIGLSFSDGQFSALDAYLAEIELWNPTYRLVGAEGNELVIKHILDSLAAVPCLTELIRSKGGGMRAFCDVGSGAGLPGIPLAIAFGDFSFTLVERMGRRAGFLRNAVAVTGLTRRVEVLQADLSEVKKKFDIVTFRAFHPLQDIVGDIGSILADGGTVCAYKSREENVVQELSAIEERSRSGHVHWKSRMVPIAVPFLDAPRMLCLLEKRKAPGDSPVDVSFAM